MVTRKKKAPSLDGAGSVLSTVSGPSAADPPASPGRETAQAADLLEKVVGGRELAAAMPANLNKPGEYGAAASTPQPGQSVQPASPLA
ncbi:MAG: catalase HPII, partial [Burkholderiaceae bacterium]|nr:catalase HPII [Burkholderiaceae bacterium]